MSEVETEKTGLEIKTGFFPLAFFLYACTPIISIDGQEHRRDWGTHFFELEEGEHTIKVFFKYFFMKECGANSIDIQLEEGKVTRVKYYMPPLVTMKGFIKEVEKL